MLKRLLLCLVISMFAVACGGGDADQNDTANSGSDTASSEESPEIASSSDSGDTGSESVDVGTDLSGTGTVLFRVGGNVDDMEDEWYLFPPGSAYVDGNWALSYFPEIDGTGDGLITISLHPDASYFSLVSTELSVTTSQDTCEFVVDRSDSDGASGSFECTDAIGFKANGSTVDGITVTGSFDANP